MRTVSEIIKKAEYFRENAITASAAYRLYVFLKWEDIPNEIKEHFTEEAKINWDIESTTENLEIDLELQIIAILNKLAKGNIVQALMFIPMLFADLFILGKETEDFEVWFKVIVDLYEADLEGGSAVDSLLASFYVVASLSELLVALAKEAELELEFDIEENLLNLMGVIDKKIADGGSFSFGIDETLERYQEITGENLLDEGDVEITNREIRELLNEPLESVDDEDIEDERPVN